MSKRQNGNINVEKSKMKYRTEGSLVNLRVQKSPTSKMPKRQNQPRRTSLEPNRESKKPRLEEYTSEI